MKFLAQQLVGAAIVSYGVFVAGVEADWRSALGYGIAAVGLSILVERRHL